MKSFVTLPTSQEFYDRYAVLLHTLNRTTPLTQIISAATEIGVIYSITYKAVYQVLPEMAQGAAITCAVLGTALLEVGLRVLFPYGWRAILYKRFKGLDLLMTIRIIAALLMLGTASGALSFKGGKQAVMDNLPGPELNTTTQEEALADKGRRNTLATFAADSANITQRYTAQIEATGASYEAQAQAARGKVQYYRQRETITGQSFASAKARYQQKATELEAEKAQAIAQLRSAEAAEIRTASQARTTALASITTNLEEARAAIEDSNQKATEEHLAKTKGIGLGVGWFTLICLFYFALVTLLFEAMKKGAGMEDKPAPNQYNFSPGILTELRGAISERWNYTTRNAIQSFADATPPAPLPANVKSLYNLAGILPTGNPIALEILEEADQGGKVLRIPRQTDKRTDNTKTIIIRSEELEEEALRLIGAAHTLEEKNYHSEAAKYWLQAEDVLKMYLGPKHTEKEFTALYNSCVDHFNGQCDNPFQEHHSKRRPIGFKAHGGDPGTPTEQENTPANSDRYNGDRYTVEKSAGNDRQRQCKHCGTTFTYKHWNKQFCGDECRLNFHAQKHGGQRFEPAEYRKGKKRRGKK